MAVPVVYSVTPSSGHTGGGQLITVNGANFKVPPSRVMGARVHGPWPGNPQDQVAFTPTVQVLFSSYQRVQVNGEWVIAQGPYVPATNVGVVSGGILQCTSPVCDPSGLPAIDAQPNRAAQLAVPPSDVVVNNLDDSGVPIPGETFTLPESYSFLRPDLTVPGVAALVLSALVLDLQRQILPNVEFNPHTDYDPTSGDFLNVTMPAALPGLALMNLKMPQSQGRPRTVEEEVTFQTSEGYVVRRAAVIRDLILTVLGVSDNQTELLGLSEALEVYFRRTGGVTLLANADDPSLGTVNFDLFRESDTIFTGRFGNSNVVAFTFTIRVVGVPFSDMPGLPVDAAAVGTTWNGNLGLTAQSTR